jgi:stage II sporulation protein D
VPLERRPVPPLLDRVVRVRLGGRAAHQNTRLSITSLFRLTDAASGKEFAPAHPVVRGGGVKPAAGRGIDLCGELLASDDLLLTPQRDASLVIDDQTYRGELRIQRQEDGLLLVNRLDIESYLRGVLRGELPRYFHEESFRAQAVAARTYVLWEKQKTPPGRIYDVLDNEGSQMYVGVRGEDAVAVRAVELTHGQVCVWEDGGRDRLFCTYYSSACGGLSQSVKNVKPNDPDAPPLRGNVPCTDCYLAPHYRWDPVKLSKSEVTRRLVARYPALTRLGTIEALRSKATTTDGRITRIELQGSDGQVETLVGEDFRLAVGGRVLKSTNFEIETGPDYFVFRNGKGFGHGLGLCQWGMETKARRGWDYQRILTTYYPGAKVVTLY